MRVIVSIHMQSKYMPSFCTALIITYEIAVRHE